MMKAMRGTRVPARRTANRAIRALRHGRLAVDHVVNLAGRHSAPADQRATRRRGGR